MTTGTLVIFSSLDNTEEENKEQADIFKVDLMSDLAVEMCLRP